MLVVKTINQVINTYQVPDVLTGDFFRWLARSEKATKNHMVHQDFLQEVVVHAYREQDPQPGGDTEQGVEAGTSGSSDEGVGSK